MSDSPIPSPKPDMIEADLRLFTRRWHELRQPAQIELRALHEKQAPVWKRFDADEVPDAAAWAAETNERGFNLYAVRNPIRPPADGWPGSATDADIIAACYLWADCDSDTATDNIKKFPGPRFTAHVVTGRTPSVRVHTYWELEDWCHDLSDWNAMQRAIAAHFGSDPAVVNPSRIMRLGGTVTWPNTKKRDKGYTPESAQIVTEYNDARTRVSMDQMRRIFASAAPQPSFQIDTGALPSLDRTAAVQAATSGQDWHNNIIRLVASYVARGLTDPEIHALTDPLTLPGYTVDQTRREVQTAINGARAKGFTPPAAPAVQAMQDQAAQAEAAAWPTPYDFFDEAGLEPRQWIYGRHYLRRFVSALASAGGIGKTSLQIVEALSICTGRPLLGEEVHQPCNVWIINLEDPMDEMQRRILAAMRHYGVTPAEVRGKLFVDAGRDFSMTFATQTREGVMPNAALCDHLVKRIPERNIGCVFIDPFVAAHQVNENDNMATNYVAAQIRQIADNTNCAFGLVHHIRKGNGDDATIDSVRGAGSLIGAVRAARVINRVTEEAAIQLGIEPLNASGIFRVDDGKANMAPPARVAVYRQMKGVQIANGEWIGVAAPFELPDEWKGMTPDVVNEMLRMIDLGPADADGAQEYYSLRPQDTERWVGNVITTFAFDAVADQKNDAEAKRIIAQWLKTGLIEEFSYRSEKQRKDRKGVRSKGRAGVQA